MPFESREPVAARIRVVCKSNAATARAIRKLEREAGDSGSRLQPETRTYAQHVMVLTTFPEKRYPSNTVLEHDRFRWQVESLFKRFKQIAQLGHLPKHDGESAQAWLYGKRFVALPKEKLIEHASAFSPWGYNLEAGEPAQPVA